MDSRKKTFFMLVYQELNFIWLAELEDVKNIN